MACKVSNIYVYWNGYVRARVRNGNDVEINNILVVLHSSRSGSVYIFNKHIG